MYNNVTYTPPRTMTGKEVKTKLYSRMKVYWYRYVASKLRAVSLLRHFPSRKHDDVLIVDLEPEHSESPNNVLQM